MYTTIPSGSVAGAHPADSAVSAVGLSAYILPVAAWMYTTIPSGSVAGAHPADSAVSAVGRKACVMP